MATKLTLSINEETIQKAKVWAKTHHTSLSGLVEGYFESLISKSDDNPVVSPKTKMLSGMFKAHNEGLSYKELVNRYKGDR